MPTRLLAAALLLVACACAPDLETVAGAPTESPEPACVDSQNCNACSSAKLTTGGDCAAEWAACDGCAPLAACLQSRPRVECAAVYHAAVEPWEALVACVCEACAADCCGTCREARIR